MKVKLVAFAVVMSLIGVAFLVPKVSAPVPDTWHAGDEFAITGHRFTEEYWTADISNTSGGATTKMTMSYVNHNDAQAFLLAFNTYEYNGNFSTLPYQLFGLHYKSPEKRDIFIGAVLAFLMVFNDTYNGTGPGENGMPDPGTGQDNVYYIIPFGIGGNITGGGYVPDVDPVPAQKLGEGHYRFGMSYKNLYAKIVDGNTPWGFWASFYWPLYIAKFSELTITYDIRYGSNNTLIAETYYVLGQVSKLWLWGIEVDPHIIPGNWGIAAVHYVATFGSIYSVTGNTTGHTIDTNIRHLIGEDLNLKIGVPPRRVFDIGFRGKFDLIDETTSTTIRSGADALNLIVKATDADTFLIGWQAAFSLGVMATMAYALGPDLQSRYSGPNDLFLHGGSQFFTSGLWYAVSFPRWDGYRIVHDPAYTAYMAPYVPPATSSLGSLLGFLLIVVFLVAIVAVIVVVAASRKKKNLPPTQ